MRLNLLFLLLLLVTMRIDIISRTSVSKDLGGVQRLDITASAMLLPLHKPLQPLRRLHNQLGLILRIRQCPLPLRSQHLLVSAGRLAVAQYVLLLQVVLLLKAVPGAAGGALVVDGREGAAVHVGASLTLLWGQGFATGLPLG